MGRYTVGPGFGKSRSPPAGRATAAQVTLRSAPMSPDPSPLYLRVEGLHLRQWALRSVVPLAVVATNGAGPVRLEGLPAWDEPLRRIGAPEAAGLLVSISGAGTVLLASALRVAAKGVLVRKTTVTCTGAYALVRHPFYLANLTGALGTFALAGPLGAVVGCVWLLAALPIYLVTIAGEEAGLRRVHGAAWDAYAARVPRLLPYPVRWDRQGARVTWSNLVEEGEPPRGLRFLAAALAVLSCRAGGAWFGPLLCAAAALWASSHVVPRSSKRTPG